jgi:tetraacyldisaccharide 4'-kinase
MLGSAGYDIAILSRGYGRTDAKQTIVLPPESTPESTEAGATSAAAVLGDEPALLRRRLPGAWMGVSANRFEAGSTILRESPRAVFILDDGFQHRGLFRNLDIVMVSGTAAAARQPGAGRMIPYGALREPLSGLRRARVVIINSDGDGDGGGGGADVGSDGDDAAKAVERNLRRFAPESVFFHCTQHIKHLISFDRWLNPQWQVGSVETPAPKSVFLVAAIGDPERFERDAERLGIAVVGRRFFRDHDAISASEWNDCAIEARMEDADAIVVTEKDAVKIAAAPDFPLLVAVQTTELREAARFKEILRSCI